MPVTKWILNCKGSPYDPEIRHPSRSIRIVAQIRAAGMGEGDRANDTNLKRAVAIKVLPALVARDAARLSRFQREAELLSARPISPFAPE